MRNFLTSLLVLFLVLGMSVGLYFLLEETARANTYKAGYTAALNELEAVYRTRGRHIDSAYTCKVKPQ